MSTSTLAESIDLEYSSDSNEGTVKKQFSNLSCLKKLI